MMAVPAPGGVASVCSSRTGFLPWGGPLNALTTAGMVALGSPEVPTWARAVLVSVEVGRIGGPFPLSRELLHCCLAASDRS